MRARDARGDWLRRRELRRRPALELLDRKRAGWWPGGGRRWRRWRRRGGSRDRGRSGRGRTRHLGCSGRRCWSGRRGRRRRRQASRSGDGGGWDHLRRASRSRLGRPGRGRWCGGSRSRTRGPRSRRGHRSSSCRSRGSVRTSWRRSGCRRWYRGNGTWLRWTRLCWRGRWWTGRRPPRGRGRRRRGWVDRLAELGRADDRRPHRRRRLRIRRPALLRCQQLVVIEAVLRTESEKADALRSALRAETCFAGHRAAWDRWLARPIVIDSDRPSYPGCQNYGPREDRLLGRRPESSPMLDWDQRLFPSHL